MCWCVLVCVSDSTPSFCAQDITSTGEEGYRFLKIDSGMTEVGLLS